MCNGCTLNSVAYTAILSHQYKLLTNTFFCIFLQLPPEEPVPESLLYHEPVPVDKEDDAKSVGPHSVASTPNI